MSQRCCTNDEGRPLGFGVHALNSKHLKRLLLRVEVVSIKEKSPGYIPRWKLGIKEMNESEPLMKCRDKFNDVKTRISSSFWDKFKGNLVTDLNGIRHRSGMTLIQALVRNVGISHSDVKRKSQGPNPREKVSMPSTEADWPVVTLKSGKPDGVKWPTYSLSYSSINRKGGIDG